ncbi:hypothetical protein [Legionella shakespearei]|nr:hypothetical protein [Legionella shakespearei]
MPIDTPQRETIRESNEMLSSHKEIQVEQYQANNNYAAVTGNATASILAGGIVNAVVSAHENYQADKALQPLKKSLKDYDYRQLFQQSLTTELSDIKWLHLKQKQITDNSNDRQKDQYIKNMNQMGDAFIFVDLSYELSHPMDHMTVTAQVELYKRDLKKSTLVYKNTFTYIDELAKPAKPMTFIDLWLANQGAQARKSMNEAKMMLSSAIAKDISDPTIRPDNKKPTNVWYSVGRTGQAAYLEEKKGKKSILRTKFGKIVIVNSQFVTTKHNWRE